MIGSIFTSHIAKKVLAIVSAVIAIAVTPSAAQDRALPPLDLALQRQADTLQRCLESRLSPLQVETTVTTEGRVSEHVRLTNWGTEARSFDRADQIFTDCAALPVTSLQNHCLPAPRPQRIVALEVLIGEPHPAWSANDRARLEDMIATALVELPGNIRVQPQASTATAAPAHILRVGLEYHGSNLSQRDLDEWIQRPRALSVNMALFDNRAAHRLLTARELTARVRPGLRSRIATHPGNAWFGEVRKQLDSALQSVLEPLACTTPWFEVTADRGKLLLSTVGFGGLKEGVNLLLVPNADAAVASRWPIAATRSSGRADTAEIEVLRGAAQTCSAGCRAVLLH